MNIYIYGGNSRFSSNNAIVKGNSQASVGQNYTFDYKKGMMMVAYPNFDATTEFEFKVWVDGYTIPLWTRIIT